LRQAVTFAVALVVAVLALGSLEYYTYETMNNQLSDTKADLNSQITELQGTITVLQSDFHSLQIKESSLSSELNSTQLSDSTFQQQTLAQLKNLSGATYFLSLELISLQNTVTQNQQTESASIQQIQSTLQGMNVTIHTLSTELAALTPQVPLSTLVIVGDTYDNASRTFQFTVQNTQTFTVYAQLSATFWGTSCSFYNSQGSYLSQVYTFKPVSNTVTTLNLNLGAYQSNQFCGHTPVVYLTMSYIAAASTSVSQTYTFNVIPYYTWS